MDKYGLIGRTLGHSFSKRYFDEKFEREGLSGATYELFELDSLENLRAWVADRDLRGFNVTVPYKVAALIIFPLAAMAASVEVASNRIFDYFLTLNCFVLVVILCKVIKSQLV